jgi:hypothetical protein
MPISYTTENTLRKRIGFILTILLIAIPSLYGVFRAYPLLAGPQIYIVYPHDGDIVASTTFQIMGRVKRASTIILQGKPITINEKGEFTETLVASPPYTILVLVATDKYGKAATTTLRVIPQ